MTLYYQLTFRSCDSVKPVETWLVSSAFPWLSLDPDFDEAPDVEAAVPAAVAGLSQLLQ